jgi:CBS domain-containing protein
MIGCAVGALESPILPNEGAGFWAMISMGAVLGGTMRSPFTAIVFVLELTHDVNAMLPLLLAVMVAHGLTVLVLRRSILTEKLSRRGLHLGREYAPDPLENVLVRQAMRVNVQTLPTGMDLSELREHIATRSSLPNGLYPILDEDGRLHGAITGRSLRSLAAQSDINDMRIHLADISADSLIVATPNETMRAIADRMARTGRTWIPVVDSERTMKFAGMLTLREILSARQRQLQEENVRARQLTLVRPRHRRTPPPAQPQAGTSS